MRHTATDDARSVVCVSVCVGLIGELCKNGRTDRDVVWLFGGRLTHVGPGNYILDCGQDSATERADQCIGRHVG